MRLTAAGGERGGTSSSSERRAEGAGRQCGGAARCALRGAGAVRVRAVVGLGWGRGRVRCEGFRLDRRGTPTWREEISQARHTRNSRGLAVSAGGRRGVGDGRRLTTKVIGWVVGRALPGIIG